MRNGLYKTRKNCRLCGSRDLSLIFDMGMMPLAGVYLKQEDIGTEKYYPLRIYFCSNCTAVQLIDIISFTDIFRDYRYLSSVGLTEHFKNYAKDVRKLIKKKDAFVVEIGSNDGVLLAPLQELGFTVLGVDPAENVARIAREKDVPTIADFFTEKKAKEIKSEYGKADAVVANNVLAHIDDMDDVGRGISALLKDDGVLIFEVHYLADLITDLQYDFFYPGEHITYYSLRSIINFYKKFDMEVFDVERIQTHGGSIRVFVGKLTAKHKKTKRLIDLIHEEKTLGINDISFFNDFAKKVIAHKQKLKKLLLQIKKENKKIIGYGAAGRGNTLLNFCSIDGAFLDYIVDASPERYGRYTPGTHIPIIDPHTFHKDFDVPAYILVLAWSYQDMIMNKEHWIKEKGGAFIIPLPKLVIK